MRKPGVGVLLVSMPFGPLRSPSLGLSLLQASLSGPSCSILYGTLRFAERIGSELYEQVARGGPRGTCLLGEWIFAASLRGERPDWDEEYLERVVRPEVETADYPALRERILGARDTASEFVDRWVEEIERLAPRMVGFTSVFEQQVASLAVARKLKEGRPELPIVFGGANCEGPMGRELVRSFPFVDAAVSGEAEAVFPLLADRLLQGEAIGDLPGVVTRADDPTAAVSPPTAPRLARHLDELPVPDFRAFFDQWTASEASATLAPRLLFETSRGCWWGEKQHCTFCGLNGRSMAFRSKSPKRALDELEELVRRHPGHGIMMVDNILDMSYFRELLPELARRRLGLRLFYEVKANLRKDQLRALRAAGVAEIQPGIESLSDEVLSIMRKGVTALQNIQLLKWCAELGVWPSWHFIWGFPGEAPAEYVRMAELLPLLHHLPPPGVAMAIRLDRFSPNFEQSEALGLVDVAPVPAYRYLYDLPAEALGEIAYYFTFGYRDDRDVDSYTRPLGAEVARWQAAYPRSELFFEDRGGALWLWDLRPVAARELTILDGASRELYRACDGIRSLDSLASRLGLESGAIEELLEPMLRDGLVLREGDRVLSLAVERPGQLAAEESY